MNARELVAPVADDILGAAAEAEETRRLPAHLMARLRAQGLFSIYTPRQFGGMELPLADALRVVEEVSRFDGSTGWTVALGMANDAFLSALPDESVATILNGGSALLTGAPGPGVAAVPVEGGYRLTGQWGFNSGASNADWMGVAAVMFEGDAPKMGAFGPEMVFCVLHPRDVEIVDTWSVAGLCATSSHDLRVEDLFVPAAFTGGFSLVTGPRAVRESTLARFPLFTLLGLSQSVPVALGIARHAVEDFRELAPAKEVAFAGPLSQQAQAQVGLARAQTVVRAASAHWYDTVEQAWETVRGGAQLPLEQRADLKMASLHAVESSVEAVDIVFRLFGATGIYRSYAFERCWRDVHAAAQHMQVQAGRWETAGKILFGLEPGSPFI